jgi:hypothetical protein
VAENVSRRGGEQRIDLTPELEDEGEQNQEAYRSSGYLGHREHQDCFDADD